MEYVKNIKAILLSIVIAIVLSSFIIYVIETVDPRPDYEDYCGTVRGPKVAPTETTPENETYCIENGGKWTANYCDYYYECNKNLTEANEKHNLKVFLIAVPAGLVSIGIGLFLGLPSVSFGLILGGIFLTIFGTANYWDNFSNWIKVVILGVVLVILIWLGYKKLGK